MLQVHKQNFHFFDLIQQCCEHPLQFNFGGPKTLNQIAIFIRVNFPMPKSDSTTKGEEQFRGRGYAPFPVSAEYLGVLLKCRFGHSRCGTGPNSARLTSLQVTQMGHPHALQ